MLPRYNTAMTVRLYDTATRSLVALPRAPGKVGIYACGPTVYGRIHIGNARPFVVFSLLKRFLEHEGLDVTLVINLTDVNDKIYDAAREAGGPSAELARRDDRRLHRRHRPPRARPPRRRAARHRDDPRDHRPDRGADRRGPRLRRRTATSTSASRSFAGYGKLSNRRLEEMDRARRPGAGARRTRSTSRSGRGTRRARTPAWDSPWGHGRPGLAHRVLGDGRGAARPGLRDPRRRDRPRLPPPRERDRADRGGPGARSPRSGCTTGWSSSARRRCRSRSATSPRSSR